MNKYFVTEGSGRNWTAVKAKTLSGAKRAASQHQTFQGTDIYVGVRDAVSGSIEVVAQKLHRNALDMSAVGEWEDVNA